MNEIRILKQKGHRKMNKKMFIAKFNQAPSTINNTYCNNIIRESLQCIPEEQNQKGSLNTVIIMEELAELQKELSKALRGKGDRMNLIEELGDVYLCVKYIQEIFDISDETLAKAVNVKLSRQNIRNGFVDKEDDI